ncbi:MAG: translation initiation factor IF-2, partial [Fusobacteriaceae bacterium]
MAELSKQKVPTKVKKDSSSEQKSLATDKPKKTKKQIMADEYQNDLEFELDNEDSEISKSILLEATHSMGGSLKNKKKKARRTDFSVKKIDAPSDSVVEEDGMKIIKISGEITIGKLSDLLKIKGTELIKELFLKGQMYTINSVISFEMAEAIALEHGGLIEKEEEIILEFGDKFSLEIPDSPKDLEPRAPVITIMGHVDHGKTSLLDAIRSTNVVEGEHGGITQKIGAYQVEKNGKKITFIDTPGHEAFTDMRVRGTQVTDIAILVIAADDGVMPQTVEAIAHAKAAKVPIIVAINKIDKDGANPSKIKQELMEHGLVSVEWGGDVEFVEVSAKGRQNLDALLETILLSAELLELKANYNKRAKGVILEAKLDQKIGAVADILIQEGKLKIGDVVVAGEAFGKVRALLNDKGEKITEVTVSEPVEIIGFTNVPQAGDILYVIQNEQHAHRIVDEVAKERRISEMSRKTLTLESLSEQFENQKIKELNLIIRADSRGSGEALRDSLKKLNTEEVAVNIIQISSGAISESDVKLAEASKAIILGFHVRPTTKAIKEAEHAGVEIRTSNIIYQIIEDIEKALTGMLEPEFKENYLGRIEIKKVFKVSDVGNVAGCVVIDGKVKNSSSIRILREGVIMYEGKLSSLKRFKDDAKEVVSGQECGLNVLEFNDIKEGDLVE